MFERKLFKWISSFEGFSNGFPHLKGISCTLDYFAMPAVEAITRTTSRGMIFLVLRRIILETASSSQLWKGGFYVS